MKYFLMKKTEKWAFVIIFKLQGQDLNVSCGSAKLNQAAVPGWLSALLSQNRWNHHFLRYKAPFHLKIRRNVFWRKPLENNKWAKKMIFRKIWNLWKRDLELKIAAWWISDTWPVSKLDLRSFVLTAGSWIFSRSFEPFFELKFELFCFLFNFLLWKNIIFPCFSDSPKSSENRKNSTAVFQINNNL